MGILRKPRRPSGSTPWPLTPLIDTPLEDRETTEMAGLRAAPEIRELVAPSPALRSAAAALDLDPYLLARRLEPVLDREGLSAATVQDAVLRALAGEIEAVALSLVPEPFRELRKDAFARWLRV